MSDDDSTALNSNHGERGDNMKDTQTGMTSPGRPGSDGSAYSERTNAPMDRAVGTRGDPAPGAVQPPAPDQASDRARPGAGRHPRRWWAVRSGSASWRTRPTPRIGLHIPWWLLALMFAATEIWVFHIQVGREAQSISISEIPLILALFYAIPRTC